MQSKIKAIMGFDVLMILVPFLVGVTPELVSWVSYILIGLSLVTMFGLAIYVEGGDELKRIELEHSKKPSWWNMYDISTDSIFVIMWALHGFYAVGLALIVVKLMTIYKIPNYYKR